MWLIIQLSNPTGCHNLKIHNPGLVQDALEQTSNDDIEISITKGSSSVKPSSFLSAVLIFFLPSPSSRNVEIRFSVLFSARTATLTVFMKRRASLICISINFYCEITISWRSVAPRQSLAVYRVLIHHSRRGRAWVGRTRARRAKSSLNRLSSLNKSTIAENRISLRRQEMCGRLGTQEGKDS